MVVIHENRGLNPHIEDVARRVALEGFVALAPDFLSPLGGTPEDEDRAREMIGQLDRPQTVQNAVAAVAFLKDQDATTDKIGVVGFCWGGAHDQPGRGPLGRTWPPRCPTTAPSRRARTWPRSRRRCCCSTPGSTSASTPASPPTRRRCKAADVDYTIYIYEGANHAFNNDTNEARYDKAAADLAWSRTIEFFKQHLAG